MTVSPLFFCLFAVLLLYEPRGVAAGCLAASLLHECGHLAAMLTCRTLPRSVTVGVFGMRIEKDTDLTLSLQNEFWIAAGGPAVNLLCGCLFLIYEKTYAAAIQFAVAGLNILPVFPLDGGMMLQCVLHRFLPAHTADVALRVVSLAVVFPLGVLGFLVLIRSGYNASLLAVDVYLIVLLLFKH
ncbi:MAG: hypothetical protein J6L00_02360 [Clostridia bacterium]|nr:hypothetical protein [Clostridia bacterium]